MHKHEMVMVVVVAAVAASVCLVQVKDARSGGAETESESGCAAEE